MNAVEIEQAVRELAEQPFDPVEFPYAFLAAFGNKETTLKRLRTGTTNKPDVGGVLQPNNIHILTCAPGQGGQALARLRSSPATARPRRNSSLPPMVWISRLKTLPAARRSPVRTGIFRTDLNIPAIEEEKTLRMTQKPSDHDGPEPHPKLHDVDGRYRRTGSRPLIFCLLNNDVHNSCLRLLDFKGKIR